VRRRRKEEHKLEAKVVLEWFLGKTLDPGHWNEVNFRDMEGPPMTTPCDNGKGEADEVCLCVRQFRRGCGSSASWPRRLREALVSMEQGRTENGGSCRVLTAMLRSLLDQVADGVSARRSEWGEDVEDWFRSQAAQFQADAGKRARQDVHMKIFLSSSLYQDTGVKSMSEAARICQVLNPKAPFRIREEELCSLRAEGMLRFRVVEAMAQTWDGIRAGNPKKEFEVIVVSNLLETSEGNMVIAPQETDAQVPTCTGLSRPRC